MNIQPLVFVAGCVVLLSSAGCQLDSDEAADAMAVDALDRVDIGAVDASVDAEAPDAFVCSCTDPVDGVCTIHSLNADDGWVLETLPDGTECERLEGPFFCNNGCGAPGVADLWYDAVEGRYVLFGNPPCVTGTEPDRWRHVSTGGDGRGDAAEEAAVTQRFNAALECPPD